MGVLTVIAYVIYIGAAVLMVFAILLQEGKGGGLSALGGTQAESAFGATNPIRRMTVVLAVLFFLIAGFLSYMGSRKRVTFGDEEPEAEAQGEREPAGGGGSEGAREAAGEKDPGDAAPKADGGEKEGDVASEAEADAAGATGSGSAAREAGPSPDGAAGPEKRPEAKE